MIFVISSGGPTNTGSIGQHTKLVLSEGAERNPAGALTILTRARKLREGLYRIFVAVSQQKSPSRSDIRLLNETLDHAPLRFEIQYEERLRRQTDERLVRSCHRTRPVSLVEQRNSSSENFG